MRVCFVCCIGWDLIVFQYISADNVRRALSLLGHEDLSKESHFENLLRRYSHDDDDDDESRGSSDGSENDYSIVPSDASDAVDSEALGGVGSTEPDVGRENDKGQHHDFTSVFSTHRTIFTPLVRLPLSMTRSSHKVLHSSEEQLSLPWPAPSYDDPDPVDGEGLMPTETDEEALAEELQDEEAIDQRDSLLDEMHEKELWATFGGDKATVSRNPRSTASSSRKRKRGENVIDEDEDDAINEDASERTMQQKKRASVLSEHDALDSD